MIFACINIYILVCKFFSNIKEETHFVISNNTELQIIAYHFELILFFFVTPFKKKKADDSIFKKFQRPPLQHVD